MLRKEDFAVIQSLHQRGVYIKDIANELEVHPRTVKRALQRGGAPKLERKRGPSKLDPYKTKVDELLAEGVWNSRVILREIQALGYEGGSTMLRLYIQPKRVMRPGRATVRFETEPGKQLQSDWGEVATQIGSVKCKVHFIVNELGYSRRFHFWCTDSEDAEHAYEGLIRGFEYFDGITKEVLVDNQKALVLEHPLNGGKRFYELIRHYGFTLVCKPYRSRTIDYIKGNFFVRYR